MFVSSSAGVPSSGDLAWHAPVRLAVIDTLPANTYAAGPPATVTANANGALPSIDGVAPAVGDRILRADTSDNATNGIYVVTDLGSAGTPWILTRAADADEAAELPGGSIVYVIAGTARNGLYYFLAGASVTNIDASSEPWRRLGSRTTQIERIYTANATWTPPATANFAGARVRCVGGGGGGGGAVVTAAGQVAMGAGGGGGGYAESWIDATALTANKAVTVGGGGAANVGAAGGIGGASSFGVLVAAGGGAGGQVSLAGAGGAGAIPGAGGVGTAGAILANGDDGGTGSGVGAQVIPTQTGGGTSLGGTVLPAFTNAPGNAGKAYGGGGSGAANGPAQAARAGGAGAAGVVIVDELYGS